MPAIIPKTNLHDHDSTVGQALFQLRAEGRSGRIQHFGR